MLGVEKQVQVRACFADLAGEEDIQSIHLAEALHTVPDTAGEAFLVSPFGPGARRRSSRATKMLREAETAFGSIDRRG